MSASRDKYCCTQKLKKEITKNQTNHVEVITGEKLRQELKNIKKELTLSKEALEKIELTETITPFEQILHEYPSREIKNLLEKNKEKQKKLVCNGNAFSITNDILWCNSLSQGKARQKKLAKFLLKSFNSEVDNLISKSKSTNFSNIVKNIENWFDRVNKAGNDDYIYLRRELLELRLQEHRYAFEFQLNREMELEEQRYLKETIREEEKVKKEIESFVKDREKEVNIYQKDINNTVKKIKLANQEELKKLQEHIENLQKKLEIAESEKERALSMAQLTRSGYVYIISNKGSFGENIFKIGMTRRLEPLDRIKELSNASVPFSFDIHALIPSDDAPTLEKQLHEKFSNQRVNKVNKRREYFNTNIDDIEVALKELVDEDIQIIKDVKSLQFEESVLLSNMEANDGKYNQTI